jgi:adenylate cyclase
LIELRKFTAKGYEQARQHFAKAIEIDPNYAEPHHLTSFAHTNDVRFGYSSDPAKSFGLAGKFAAQALAIEPENAEALAMVAFLRFVQKKIPESLEIAYQALEKAPNEPGVTFALAWILLYSGDPESAITYYTKIKRLAPVPSFAILNGDLLAHIYAGKYEEAKKLVPVYLARTPEALRPANLVFAAIPFFQTNQIDKANSMVEEALNLDPNLSISVFRPFDLPFVDKSIPESFYVIYRKLGIPDLPE